MLCSGVPPSCDKSGLASIISKSESGSLTMLPLPGGEFFFQKPDKLWECIEGLFRIILESLSALFHLVLFILFKLPPAKIEEVSLSAPSRILYHSMLFAMACVHLWASTGWLTFMNHFCDPSAGDVTGKIRNGFQSEFVLCLAIRPFS